MRADGCGGFTLLEMIVVVALAGVIAGIGLVGLKLPAADPAAAALERLATLLEQQRFEAALLGEQRGLRIRRDGYAPYRYDADLRRWFAAGEPRRLAATLRPRLLIDGRPVALDDVADGAPQLLLLSNGEASEFRLELGAGAGRYRLDGDLLGRLRQTRAEP